MMFNLIPKITCMMHPHAPPDVLSDAYNIIVPLYKQFGQEAYLFIDTAWDRSTRNNNAYYNTTIIKPFDLDTLRNDYWSIVKVRDNPNIRQNFDSIYEYLDKTSFWQQPDNNAKFSKYIKKNNYDLKEYRLNYDYHKSAIVYQ